MRAHMSGGGSSHVGVRGGGGDAHKEVVSSVVWRRKKGQCLMTSAALPTSPHVEYTPPPLRLILPVTKGKEQRTETDRFLYGDSSEQKPFCQ